MSLVKNVCVHINTYRYIYTCKFSFPLPLNCCRPGTHFVLAMLSCPDLGVARGQLKIITRPTTSSLRAHLNEEMRDEMCPTCPSAELLSVVVTPPALTQAAEDNDSPPTLWFDYEGGQSQKGQEKAWVYGAKLVPTHSSPSNSAPFSYVAVPTGSPGDVIQGTVSKVAAGGETKAQR